MLFSANESLMTPAAQNNCNIMVSAAVRGGEGAGGAEPPGLRFFGACNLREVEKCTFYIQQKT